MKLHEISYLRAMSNL